MFSYTSVKDPTEAVTVGEHRARKARERERELVLSRVETQSTISSTGSTGSHEDGGASRPSGDWDGLKIVVTRSFGVEEPYAGRLSTSSSRHKRSPRASAMLAAEIVPFASTEDGDQDLHDVSDDGLIRAYATECAFVHESNPLLEELIEMERREQMLHGDYDLPRASTATRPVDEDPSNNPFYFPPAVKPRLHST